MGAGFTDTSRRCHTATPARAPSSSKRRARCAYVCSSRTRSRARRPISSACAGIGDQLAVRGDRLLHALDDEQLATRLEPALDALVRIRDDRRPGRGELERARRRRSRNGRVWSSRHVEVDPRSGDRARKCVERHVPEERAPDPCPPGSRAHPARCPDRVRGSTARRPSSSSSPGETCRRSRRRRRRPPSRRPGARRTRDRRPSTTLRPARTELEQPSDPSLRVRQHQVVLPRIRAVIRVEAGVHSPELRKAHRYVAVVEDDRYAEPGAKRRRGCPADAPSEP